MIHPTYASMKEAQQKLIHRKNKIDETFYNGIYQRYVYPVITRDHVPIEWRYDLDQSTNPFFAERLGVNATFNSGAILFENRYYLVVRVEGLDRKSIFAIASSDQPTEGFAFDRLIQIPDTDLNETNRYDMRLTAHEDGYIYGIYCAEKKNFNINDTMSATAEVGIIRTKNLKDWERLPNLITQASQQRNVVLHPEFVNKKYAFYTRPQDGFIDVGFGGGISLGYVNDMTNPQIDHEQVIHHKVYHTIYEYKNGQGPAPIKTSKGWLHLAHGVRQTAAGLRYVLYMFATDLVDIDKVIAKPSGYLIAPLGPERIGDVSNVVFSNGWIVHHEDVYIYYASSDTRLHVAKTTIAQLIDYTFNTPSEVYRSADSTNQRQHLIEHNEALKSGGKDHE